MGEVTSKAAIITKLYPACRYKDKTNWSASLSNSQTTLPRK